MVYELFRRRMSEFKSKFARDLQKKLFLINCKKSEL